MSIRTATADDAEAIAQVHITAWQQAYREILPAEFLARLSIEKRQALWAESIAKNLPQVLVAEISGQIVGFSAIGPCRDQAASATAFEIWAIYASPSHWSTGIGRELWLASREASFKLGARSISLWVLTSNERAIKFYRAAGFKPEASSVTSLEIGGTQVQEIRYTQRLNG